MALFMIGNFPMQQAAAPVAVATGTSIKTLLQIKASATLPFKIVEWGISFDGYQAAQPGRVELIEIDVAATVTAFVAADLSKYDAEALACGDPTTNLLPVGTSAGGYTSTGEGSLGAAVVRNLAGPQLIAPTNQFIQQFPLGREPIVRPDKFMRIRVHFPATVNALCYALIQV